MILGSPNLFALLALALQDFSCTVFTIVHFGNESGTNYDLFSISTLREFVRRKDSHFLGRVALFTDYTVRDENLVILVAKGDENKQVHSKLSTYLSSTRPKISPILSLQKSIGWRFYAV